MEEMGITAVTKLDKEIATGYVERGVTKYERGDCCVLKESVFGSTLLNIFISNHSQSVSMRVRALYARARHVPICKICIRQS